MRRERCDVGAVIPGMNAIAFTREVRAHLGEPRRMRVQPGFGRPARRCDNRLTSVQSGRINASFLARSHGPFAMTNDLVAGFWLIQVKSMDDAIGWMKRAPFDGGAEIEIREVFDTEDFGEALTPELRDQENRLRAQQVGRK